MGSGIFTRKARKRIFHDKIQQALLISQDSAPVRGAIRVLRKSLLLVFKKSHNLVLSCAMATSNPTHKQTEKKASEKRREDWEREGE